MQHCFSSEIKNKTSKFKFNSVTSVQWKPIQKHKWYRGNSSRIFVHFGAGWRVGGKGDHQRSDFLFNCYSLMLKNKFFNIRCAYLQSFKEPHRTCYKVEGGERRAHWTLLTFVECNLPTIIFHFQLTSGFYLSLFCFNCLVKFVYLYIIPLDLKEKCKKFDKKLSQSISRKL